jgi:HAD superfamily phosphoserine phosphatase-like hydrolase
MRSLKYPLMCFDLDVTLVDDTVFIWKTLHDTLKSDQVLRKRARDDYFAGRITYKEWFDCDLELFDRAGADKNKILATIDALKPMPGAFEIIDELKKRGHILAIVSGSLDIVVDRLFGKDRFDHLLINRISFDVSGRIAGGEPTPYDFKGKAEGLKELARRESLPLSATAFVGDNENDLWIAKAAGLAIAFNCKSDELKNICQVEIKEKDLRLLADVIK